MFIDVVMGIKEDLQKYKRNREELHRIYIEKRLNESLTAYYKELIDSINFLEYKDSLRLLRNLNKE